MVARPGQQQSSLNSGEIGAELDARFDLKQWYQAAKRMKNAEPVPQGGFKLMPGSLHRGRVRKAVEAIADGIVSSDETAHAAEATVKTLTLDGPATVAMVELAGFTVDDDSLGAVLTVQYQAGAGPWTDFAPAFATSETARSRLAARPPGAGVLATALRVQVSGMSGAVVVAIDDIAAWSETAALVACEAVPFTFSEAQVYWFLLTPGFVDIWRDGVHVGAARAAVTLGGDPASHDYPLRAAKEAQQFDTLFLFYKLIASQRIMRRGADHEWQYDDIPWEDIARVDFGDTAYPTTTDKWDIFVRWAGAAKPDLYLDIIVDGEDTGAIPLAAASVDYTAWKAAIVAALEALPSMKPGVVVTHALATNLITLTIEFAGDNAGGPFDLTAQIVNTSEASSLVSHVQIGDTLGEPVMSAERGWPGVGAMFQDRLITTGFYSKPAGVLASRSGEYFDLNIKATGSDAALLVALGTDAAEEANHLVVARHLLVFTNSAEYFVSDRVILKTQPPNFVQTSKHGSHPNAGIVEIDGDVYYVAKEGALIYAARYDDVSTSYQSDPVSLLASHLMVSLRDLAVQRASLGSDAARLLALRSDGRLVMGAIIRGQDVLAFGEWATSGTLEAIMVDGANHAVLAVRRTVAGVAEIVLEEMDEDELFHGAIRFDLEEPASEITGLDIHEGEEVWAEADGHIVGPFTVAGGAITLPVAASSGSVGRWTPPEVETLPQIKVLPDNSVLLRPGRIHAVRASIVDTTSIAIGANGRRPRDVGLYRGGAPTDVALPGATRWVAAEGIPGFVEEGPTAVFTQLKPGRLRVTGWVLERS